MKYLKYLFPILLFALVKVSYADSLTFTFANKTNVLLTISDNKQTNAYCIQKNAPGYTVNISPNCGNTYQAIAPNAAKKLTIPIVNKSAIICFKNGSVQGLGPPFALKWVFIMSTVAGSSSQQVLGIANTFPSEKAYYKIMSGDLKKCKGKH